MSPAKKASAGPPGRYLMDDVCRRVERLRISKGVERKTICEALGMERWDWSRKVRQDGSTFSIEELGQIAEYLGAPIGWPFLSEDTSRLIESILNHRK